MQRSPQKSTISFLFSNKYLKKTLMMIQLIIIAAIFILIFTKLPYKQIYEVVININIYIAIVIILLSFVSIFLYSVFLWISIQEKGISISILKLLGINLGMKFYSLFSPISLAGIGVRIFRIAENHRLEDALSAITFSRIIDTIVTIFDGILWIIISLFFYQINVWLIIGVLASVILFWISFLLLSKPTIHLLDKITESNMLPPLLIYLLEFLKKFIDSLVLFRQLKPTKLFFLIITSLVYDLINTSIHFILAHSIGIQISFITIGWIRSVIAISSLIPIYTIGGLGIKEISSYYLFMANGVPPETAITFSFMNYLRTLLVSTTGGIIEIINILISKRRSHI